MKIEVKLVAIREPWKQRKPRVYFWPEGENVLENLVNRTSRPYTAYRKLLPTVLAQAEALGGKALAHAKANWSKHAGCTTCPCSPGFVLSGHSVHLFGYDIHVTLSQDAVPATTGGEQLEHRARQLGYSKAEDALNALADYEVLA